MNRLVGLWILSWALIGCTQNREGLRPTEGLPPVGLPPGQPPIQERVNAGPDPFPPRMHHDRSMGATPTAPIGGEGIEPSSGTPARLTSTPTQAEPSEASGLIHGELASLPSDSPPIAEPIEEEPRILEDRALAGATEIHPEASPVAARSDPEVIRASATQETPEDPSGTVDQESVTGAVAGEGAEVDLPIGTPVGEWAARVDNDIITWNELQSEVARRFRELDPQLQSAPGVRESIAANVLDHLIDRSLVIQKARRNELKDAKRWELINKFAMELFETERLPALLKKYNVEDRYALERALAERNESFDEILDSFKLEAIYQQFLMLNVASKVHVDLPELRAYYFENRDHESFQQGPELTWREIHIRFANYPSREEAWAVIDEALSRVGQGAPFEEIARTMGEGPNREAGGLWTTAPGTYAVASVNAALGRLKPGQTSEVLEGPNGLHLVRLESVRPAGRKRFEDVQDQIRTILQTRKQTELIESYLKDLYRGAVVTTVFKEYVPRHLRDEEAGG